MYLKFNAQISKEMISTCFILRLIVDVRLRTNKIRPCILSLGLAVKLVNLVTKTITRNAADTRFVGFKRTISPSQ